MAGHLTRDQKCRVALALIHQAGNLVEFWTDITEGECEDITAEQARECLASWLIRLPGDAWDTRLDSPNLTDKES